MRTNLCAPFTIMEVILLCFPYYLSISLLLKAVHAKNTDLTIFLPNLHVDNYVSVCLLQAMFLHQSSFLL